MVAISSDNLMKQSTQATQSIPDIVTKAIPDDERLWVPQTEKIWFRPLILNTTNGEWINLLRISKGGVMNRHRHPAPNVLRLALSSLLTLSLGFILEDQSKVAG